MKKSIRRMIAQEDFLGIIEIIMNDNDNNYGNYLYGELPTTDEWDHVFEVYERFYDLSNVFYKIVRRQNKFGKWKKYNSVENVKRRIEWQ